MDYNFKFPENLYSEVRMEEKYGIWLTIQNGEVENDGESAEVGAMVRVFDGNMWYTATTNSLDEIQSQLVALAAIAAPNPQIMEHPIVKELDVNRDERFRYDGETDLRKVTRAQWKEILDGYIEKCVDPEDKEVSFWSCGAGGRHLINHPTVHQ